MGFNSGFKGLNFTCHSHVFKYRFEWET